MRLLLLGDVVGKPGRELIKHFVPLLRSEFALCAVIANGENAANGGGFTFPIYTELKAYCDVITSGDHTWDQKGFETDIARAHNLVRPANVSAMQPGKGFGVFTTPIGQSIAVINLQGKVFMKDSAYCPFETVDRILKTEKLPKTIIVDFHAEATSEKIAMGRYLDGRVTAVVGTHTHVQTNDPEILPGGTAYLTDLGMCGPQNSVLGRGVNEVLFKLRSGMPTRLPVVEALPYRMDGAIVEFNAETGRATGIQTLRRMLTERTTL